MKWTICVVWVAILGIWLSCGSDREVVVDDLIGVWEVTAAEREGRSTETLNGAIFDFRDDGTMMTNISGQEDEGPFVYESMHIHHQGQLDAEYRIDTYEVDSMRLEVTLHQLDFAFKLNRKNTE
ncbi:MAG: hypothetical protein R3330_16460 [Saprospiraceae bacterium]|nr:hypothetical protein [Saprospiraceae bacterium]